MLNKNLFLGGNIERKKQNYLNMLYNILEMPNGNDKVETFIKLYTSYCKFCYQHKLNTYNLELFTRATMLFIIESRPLEYGIDNTKKQEALYRLEKVLVNRKNGIPDGISIEDANLILATNVQNARICLSNDSKDFFEDSLAGSCGLSQAITTFPLLELGVKMTINNTSSLPDCECRHAFATCTLPIKHHNQIYERQFLIDATYRQFFLAIECNEGRYFTGDPRFKGKVAPSAGYYVCKTPEGISFATELLKKGYVELTEDNAKIYGNGFSCESIYLSTPINDRKRIINHTGKEYINAINNKNLQESLDYTTDELKKYGYNVSLHNHIGHIKRVTEEEISTNRRKSV